MKVCTTVDGRLPSLYKLYLANRERVANVLNENTKSIIKGDTVVEQLLINARTNDGYDLLISSGEKSKLVLNELALQCDRMWKPGRKLTVKFLDGDMNQRLKVTQYANEWTNYANIEFDWVTSNKPAEIRIAFRYGFGSWSAVGTEALDIKDQNQPTMNFGWFDNATLPEDYRATILHEFGHCLGCIHEHQSPAAGIKWDVSKVYDFYKNENPPWDKAKVDHNVLAKADQSNSLNSPFDPTSIMLYPISKELTTDGYFVDWNTKLSANDVAFIKASYPGK